MASLSYATAARIASRELRSSPGKFAFVILSVAIGVAALTGVRGFSASFRSLLTLRARSIMAGDLSARTSQAISPNQQQGLNKITQQGTATTQVTEFSSMASTPTSLDPLLVSIKAVDPTKYPFYGSVDLSPAMPVAQALTPTTVAVGDDLLIRLHLHLGDQVKLGNGVYRIVATVINEPDRLGGAFAAGPRVLMSDKALASAGLMGFGSRASKRYLFKMPQSKPGQASSDQAVAALKQQLETLFPEALVTDYREANPALTRGLDNATGLLSLMSLVALVLGAVGVAMAMRAHLQQRLDSIAIMKSLGAQSSHVIRIYVMQTLFLGLAGGLLGVVLGLGVQMIFPFFLARLLQITPGFHVDLNATAIGLGAGLLTTLLFTLPPLLDIRSVRPILILRRAVEVSDDPFTTRFLRKLRGSAAQLVAILCILAGLVLLATRISDSARVGWIFALGLATVLLVLLGMSALTLRLLRAFLARTRLGLPSSLRHGLANLYRPGNPSAALLAALGLGVMQIMTVYFVQQAVVRDLSVSLASNIPNIFLVDVAAGEVEGVRTLLQAQPEVKGAPEMIPVIGGRLIAINGKADDRPSTDANGRPTPRLTRLRNVNLTWFTDPASPPPGAKITSGKWWTAQQSAAGAQHPIVAIEQTIAKRLEVKPGDTLTFGVQDTRFTATIAAVYESDSQHAWSRADYILPEPTLHGLSVIWYAGVHTDPARTSELQRALYAAYPTITVINVAATIEVIRQVALQITYIIQFLAGFSIFAGIVILASSIAGTRYRRIREVVVLKTLGATRPRIATIFSIEFAVLGLIAATVGLIFANVSAALVQHYVLKIPFHFQPVLTLFALALTALLTVAAGWLASHRILGQKPLEVLREE